MLSPTLLSLLIGMTVGGDSFTARGLQAYLPTTTPSCASGVITYPATAHGLATGEYINATGSPVEAANVVRVQITRVDANTFTFPAPGVADGSAFATGGPATYQVMAYSQQTSKGIPVHLNRMTRGALKLLANAGCSGYQMAPYAARYATALQPYPATLHIHDGYFNDCQFSVANNITPALSVATILPTLLKRQEQGALVMVCSAMPIPSGVYSWPSGMNDALGAAWVVQWNYLMRSECLRNGFIFLDVYTQMVDPLTGYALAGFCEAGDIHPSWKGAYTKAKAAFAALTPAMYRPVLLTSSLLDNVGNNANNRNVARSAPLSLSTGGGANTTGGGTITTAYQAWAASTAIGAKTWRTNAGHLYFNVTGAATTGTTPPTHTAGAVSDGTVTWQYMDEAVGTAGVPAGWGVQTNGSPDTFSAIVPSTLADGTTSYDHRVSTVFNAANDQVLIFYGITTTDVAIGDVCNLHANASLITTMNTTAATVGGLANTNQTAPNPSAQNVKSFFAQLAETIDGNVYVPIECKSGATAANEMQAEDMVNILMSVPDVQIYPGTALTSLRPGFIAQAFGAGRCSLRLGRLTCRH